MGEIDSDTWHQWPETNRQTSDFMLCPGYRDGNRPGGHGNVARLILGALIHKASRDG